MAAREITATRRRPDQVLWEVEELPVLSHGTALFRMKMNRRLRVFMDSLAYTTWTDWRMRL
jgi:hypothetical protein